LLTRFTQLGRLMLFRDLAVLNRPRSPLRQAARPHARHDELFERRRALEELVLGEPQAVGFVLLGAAAVITVVYLVIRAAGG